MASKAIVVSVNTSASKTGFKVFNRRGAAPGVLTSVFGLMEYVPVTWQKPQDATPTYGFTRLAQARQWTLGLLRKRPDLEVWEVQYIPYPTIITPMVVSPSACRATRLRVRDAKATFWARVRTKNVGDIERAVSSKLYRDAPFGTVLMDAVHPVKKVFSI